MTNVIYTGLSTSYQAPNTNEIVRFLVLTAVSMKMIVCWDIVPCGLAEIYQRIRGAYCLHHHCYDNGGSKHL
jgi:hypothetical protein